MKLKLTIIFFSLITSQLLSAETIYQANKACPAALDLSSFEEAMTASFNHQDLVLTRMMAEGSVLQIRTGTKGEFLQRYTLMNGQMPVVRFAYTNNPNGFYGVWTLENCFSIYKPVYEKKAKKNTAKGNIEVSKMVLNIQKYLNKLGYNAGKEDGINGKNTIEAIKIFQKDQGAIIDGKATRLLLGTLHELYIQRDVSKEKTQFTGKTSSKISLMSIDSIAVGDEITILTVNNRARLCMKPLCRGNEDFYLRLNTGVTLKINEIKDVSPDNNKRLWFKVLYKNIDGWISMYDANIDY